MSIRFEKLTHQYSPGTPFAFTALQDVDLEFTMGKITAIVGATGSGKSTLVQHLNALLLPTSGSVTVDEYTVTAGSKLKNIKSLRKKVGLVFQFAEYQLFEETLVKDVSFGPKNFGVPVEEAEQLAKEALKTVGIQESYFEKSPLELSGGQKRRVAIAGIVAMQPEILVLDEPTAGLDPQGATSMMNLFRKLNRENGITVLIVTHNMEHVLEYCDEVVVLEKGKVIIQTDIKSFFGKSDYMERALINPPAIVRFKQACHKRGLDIPAEILNVDDMADYLAKRKKK